MSGTVLTLHIPDGFLDNEVAIATGHSRCRSPFSTALRKAHDMLDERQSRCSA